jgi:L-amino acid N-acyltransferase YncA
MIIRKVKPEDAPQIAEIYNYYIKNTHHTFETELLNVEETEERLKKISTFYPYLVAEENGEILGYAHAARFKLRQAYQHTAEVMIYVKNEAKKRGVGTNLYMDLFNLLEETDIHVMIAGIALPNDSSVKFHETLGFTKVAHFKEIGYKLGRWFDVGYWQLTNRI